MNWRKSRYSGGSDCVEAASWRKSGHSAGQGECVEAGDGPGVIAVRDTKNRGAGPVLTFTPAAWQAFMRRLKDKPGHSETCA